MEATLEAVDELIRRGEPIERVTVERLSQRAGIGLGSFYEYFADKDSVLGVLIGRVTRSNFEQLSRKLDESDRASLESVIHDFAHQVVDTYLAHPNRTRVMLEGVGRLGLARFVHDQKDRFAQVMALRAAAMRGDAVDRAATAADLSAIGLSLVHRRHPLRIRTSAVARRGPHSCHSASFETCPTARSNSSLRTARYSGSAKKASAPAASGNRMENTRLMRAEPPPFSTSDTLKSKPNDPPRA